MLSVTQHAANVISDLVQQHGLAAGSGLRIAADRGSLTVSLAPVPAADDAVVEADRAVVFLEPVAAEALYGKTLDATTNAEGQTQFTVIEGIG